MKSTHISAISLIIIAWLFLLQSPVFSQQLYTLKKSNGTIEQAPVKEVTLTFDNNGSLTQSRNGIKKSILFSSINLIYFAEKINKVPIANAGPDQTVNENTIVMLDGSISSDPDGTAMTYQWTSPTGITLNSNTIARPTFTAPEVIQDTPYTFSLLVSDGTASSTVDQVVITVKNVNKVPIANAGPDLTVNENTTVSIDASLSADLDSNPLTYKWTAPAGITLSSVSVQKPSFTAPEVKKDSILTFTLVVYDGIVDSSPASVRITVKNVIKVGISDISVTEFKVYPNPTTGEVYFEFGESVSTPVVITVYNTEGSVVKTMFAEANNKLTIDLAQMISGWYFIKVESETNSYLSKVLLQK